MYKSFKSHRKNEKGVLAVELAYAFPFLLLVFMLMIFLCDLILVKHHLNVSLNQTMRVCASKNTQPPQQCIANLMTAQLEASGVAARCDLNQVVLLPPQNGVLISEVGCHYNGFAPLEAIFYLSQGGLGDLNALLDLKVSAAYPLAL